YPGVEYNDHQFRQIMSFCFKHLEKFLVHQSYFAEELKPKIRLAQVYRERNLTKHFRSSIREANVAQEGNPIRNADYYSEHFKILLEEYQFSLTDQRTGAKNLQEISDNIDIAYLTLKLRQTCLSLSHQAVYKTEYRFGMLQEMIQYIEDQQLLDIPAVAMYYYCYNALTKPEEFHFFEKLKTALLQNASLFPKREIKDLFLLTINYCVKRLNKGDRKIVPDLFDLYKEGLRQEYLLTNGILSRFTYQNIATMGLIQKDYNWLEQFNTDYKDHMEKQYRESSYSYNMARLAYAKKNYDHVLALLQKANYKDLLQNLAIKTIALKTYYELNEITLLESHMDAMKNFIRRKKDLGYHRDLYLNLIYYTRQLLERSVKGRAERRKLKEVIAAEQGVAEKDWLIEQLS
ncbi:MAG: hypothetical protein AB8F74_05225, partial [Saprospiraceae bacterium]